jgi:hypothetical protein
MKLRILLAFCLGLGLSLIALPELHGQLTTSPAASVWVDATGKFRIEASFIRLEGPTVVLRRSDGKEISVPLEKLAPDSQRQAQALAKQATASAITSPSPQAKPSPRLPPTDNTVAVIPIPPNLHAQQFVDFIVEQVRAGQTIVFWDALPASYQQDVRLLVQAVVEKVDNRFTMPLMTVRNDALKVLRSKKEFILNHELVKPTLPDAILAAQIYDPAVDVIDAYLSSDLLDVQQLKNNDIRSVIVRYFSNIARTITALEKAIPADSPWATTAQAVAWRNFQHRVENSSETMAMVTLEIPEQAPQTLEIVKVEDRWLPKAMVEGWAENVDKARKEIDSWTPQKMAEAKQALQLPVMMAQGVLGGLLAANDQASFDAAIASVLAMLPTNAAFPIPQP